MGTCYIKQAIRSDAVTGENQALPYWWTRGPRGGAGHAEGMRHGRAVALLTGGGGAHSFSCVHSSRTGSQHDLCEMCLLPFSLSQSSSHDTPVVIDPHGID